MAKLEITTNANKEIPASWNPEVDFRGWPDAKLYKQWCPYDRARYAAYKKYLKDKGSAARTDNIALLKAKLAELKIDNHEINALVAALETKNNVAHKTSTIEKIFGQSDVEAGSKIPLVQAIFRGPNGERMYPGETLDKFMLRIAAIPQQKYTIAQLGKLVKEDTEHQYKITDEFITLVK